MAVNCLKYRCFKATFLYLSSTTREEQRYKQLNNAYYPLFQNYAYAWHGNIKTRQHRTYPDNNNL